VAVSNSELAGDVKIPSCLVPAVNCAAGIRVCDNNPGLGSNVIADSIVIGLRNIIYACWHRVVDGKVSPCPIEGNIDIGKVFALAEGGTVGRMHLARVLVDEGYISTTGEAFYKYIGDKGPAYVCGFKLTPPEAIKLIRQAGGIAVLAHPYSLDRDELIEYATHMDNSLKYNQNDNVGKIPLRKILERHIDPSLITPNKQGFSVNTANLWKSHGKKLCDHYLDNARIIQDGWIN